MSQSNQSEPTSEIPLRKTSESKAYWKAYQQTPEYKAKQKAYDQTPEVKAKKKAYQQTPEAKAKRKAYRQTPEYKAKRKAYEQTPEYKAKKRAREQTPEYKAKKKEKDKAYQQTPEVKAKKKARRQTPEFKAKKKEKDKAYNQTPEAKAKKKASHEKRLKRDSLYASKCILRNAVLHTFKRIGKNKPTNTLKLLGCDWKTAKAHFEALFKEGMSWDNHGKWHIDHIRPVSSFREDDLHMMNHISNLQPLWADENWEKSDKIL